MFDLQTHLLPDDRDELAKLAVRMGYREHAASLGPGRVRVATTHQRTDVNRKILDHLLHDAFPGRRQRPSRKSTWCTIPIRRRSESSKCSAATRSDDVTAGLSTT